MDDGVYKLRVEMGQIGLKIFRTLRVVSELAGARAGGHGDPPLQRGEAGTIHDDMNRSCRPMYSLPPYLRRDE